MSDITKTGRNAVYTDPKGYLKFLIGLGFVEIVGIVMIVLCALWMNSLGGFGWDISIVFNYHPVGYNFISFNFWSKNEAHEIRAYI
jgi:hypothetical protein